MLSPLETPQLETTKRRWNISIELSIRRKGRETLQEEISEIAELIESQNFRMKNPYFHRAS
jgi:hypothetical protein